MARIEIKEIEIGKLETGFETKEGLKRLLQIMAGRSLAVKGPNPAAERVQRLAERDDFVERIGDHFDDIEVVFKDAESLYERLTPEEVIRRLQGL